MEAATIGSTLSKDDFLKLFTLQLKYQNPLKPMDSTEFTAQLAQFSSLEQLYNMNNGLQDLLAYQGSMNNGIIAGLLGKSVKMEDGTTGTITGVSFRDNTTHLSLNNGQEVLISDVQEIY